MNPGVIRIGLLLDGYMQPSWVAKTMEEISADPRFEIAVVALNSAVTSGTPDAVRRTFFQKVAGLWKNKLLLPYELFTRLERARYVAADDPELMVDLEPLLVGRETIAVMPRMTKHCDYFEREPLQQIGELHLDVMLRLGFRILKGEVLTAARYGMWSFHHADNEVNRGGPPGLWEMVNGEGVTGATLQVLTEELDAGLVLARSYSSTDTISLTANKKNQYWQARHLLTRKLSELYERREKVLDDARASGDWAAYSQPLYLAPGPMATTRLAVQIASRLVRRKWQAIRSIDQWFLAYRFAPGAPRSDNVPDGTMYRFKEVYPPADRFWADPMVVVENGKHLVFFEELIFASPKGHICVWEFDRKGPVGEPRRVLERPYHLSYPFVFQWNGDWYMVPETVKNRSVELYKATNFPDAWEFDRTLLSGLRTVDATLAEIGGRWWMFVGVAAEGASEGTMLNIFHSNTPLGPWEAHKQNPVKIDVRSARPAGPLFQQNSHWYRPAQCGTPTYGSSMVVNRIDELTPEVFRETLVSVIQPNWKEGINGTHTIAAAAGLTVIDARRSIARTR